MRLALANEKVDPPLTNDEQGIVRTLTNVREGLARRKVEPPYLDGWKLENLGIYLDRIQGKKVDYPLTEDGAPLRR